MKTEIHLYTYTMYNVHVVYICYSNKLKEHDQHHLLVCGHSQVQLLEDMHNCTSLKSLMFKKTIDFTKQNKHFNFERLKWFLKKKCCLSHPCFFAFLPAVYRNVYFHWNNFYFLKRTAKKYFEIMVLRLVDTKGSVTLSSKRSVDASIFLEEKTKKMYCVIKWKYITGRWSFFMGQLISQLGTSLLL